MSHKKRVIGETPEGYGSSTKVEKRQYTRRVRRRTVTCDRSLMLAALRVVVDHGMLPRNRLPWLCTTVCWNGIGRHCVLDLDIQRIAPWVLSFGDTPQEPVEASQISQQQQDETQEETTTLIPFDKHNSRLVDLVLAAVMEGRINMTAELRTISTVLKEVFPILTSHLSSQALTDIRQHERLALQGLSDFFRVAQVILCSSAGQLVRSWNVLHEDSLLHFTRRRKRAVDGHQLDSLLPYELFASSRYYEMMGLAKQLLSAVLAVQVVILVIQEEIQRHVQFLSRETVSPLSESSQAHGSDLASLWQLDITALEVSLVRICSFCVIMWKDEIELLMACRGAPEISAISTLRTFSSSINREVRRLLSTDYFAKLLLRINSEQLLSALLSSDIIHKSLSRHSSQSTALLSPALVQWIRSLQHNAIQQSHSGVEEATPFRPAANSDTAFLELYADLVNMLSQAHIHQDLPTDEPISVLHQALNL